MEAIPDLTPSLMGLAAFNAQTRATVEGPRRWWHGELDVEGLALGAVQAAATALNALTNSNHYSVESAITAASFDSLGHLRIDDRKPEGFAPLSGFRRTSDGWVRLHANYPHHAARLMEALSASGPPGVDAALLRMTSLEAEQAIASNNGVAAAVRPRSEWTTTAMHTAVSGPWISLELPSASGAAPPPEWVPSTGATPLAGLKVLDLTRVIAGPIATRLLGALGADVLRIDPPRMPELLDAFIDTGFDKRSAEADFSDPDALVEVGRLIEAADVVVSGYRAGGLDRFGLDPSTLLDQRPGLVVVALSAWGTEGPWRGRRGFDSLVQAACGIATRYGRTYDDGWRPGALPVQALDHATGYGLAAATIALLAERLQTGIGGIARLSLARTAEELLAHPAVSLGDERLREPSYRIMDCDYGRLRHVGPPLMVDGVPLTYTRPPVRYGSSQLRWR
ncbi:CoA transferase [Paenarthrobacter sp. NPDC092416]|uniref:CoA transferase n=1 Tax=Paenarthrobacter sp. NPDC092416 TaxID=3364386 RepID=UPI00381932B2